MTEKTSRVEKHVFTLTLEAKLLIHSFLIFVVKCHLKVIYLAVEQERG